MLNHKNDVVLATQVVSVASSTLNSITVSVTIPTGFTSYVVSTVCKKKMARV